MSIFQPGDTVQLLAHRLVLVSRQPREVPA